MIYRVNDLIGIEALCDCLPRYINVEKRSW